MRTGKGGRIRAFRVGLTDGPDAATSNPSDEQNSAHIVEEDSPGGSSIERQIMVSAGARSRATVKESPQIRILVFQTTGLGTANDGRKTWGVNPKSRCLSDIHVRYRLTSRNTRKRAAGRTRVCYLGFSAYCAIPTLDSRVSLSVFHCGLLGAREVRSGYVSNKSALIFSIFVAGLGTTLVPCLVPDLSAQSAENVAIIINDNSPASQRIGEYYARKHALPPSNVIRIRTSAEETIERLAYLTSIEQPIAAAIAHEGLQDRILYPGYHEGRAIACCRERRASGVRRQCGLRAHALVPEIDWAEPVDSGSRRQSLLSRDPRHQRGSHVLASGARHLSGRAARRFYGGRGACACGQRRGTRSRRPRRSQSARHPGRPHRRKLALGGGHPSQRARPRQPSGTGTDCQTGAGHQTGHWILLVGFQRFEQSRARL